MDKWTPSTAMVSATVNFAIATGWLDDRKDKQNEEELEEELSEGEEVGMYIHKSQIMKYYRGSWY